MKALLFFTLVLPAPAASILWDPLPYLSEADSPFYQGILSGDIYLEDFEDQALNTPFVRHPDNVPYFGFTYRQLVPDITDEVVRSVDGDDGMINFQGFLGDSWITTADPWGGALTSRVSFEFLPNDNNLFPRFVGIVVTAVDDFDRDVSLAFFDENNINVSNDSEYDPKDWSPIPLLGTDTRLHRFIGFYHEEGIHRLSLSNVWQVDHLQYGYAIPEPSTSFLMGTALIPFLRRKRTA